jgi:hypothetical protein
MINGQRPTQERAVRKTTFFQLVQVVDKASALRRAVQEQRTSSSSGAGVFNVPLESFAQVPGSPFAYWISEAIRRLFSLHERFEQTDRIVRQGGVTGDDARFLRLYWEVPGYKSGKQGCRWVPFAKGGNVSLWYADYPVVVAWDDQRTTFFGYTGLLHRASEKPSSADHYFRPGLTWPLRASRFAPAPLPAQSIFSIRGYAILAPKEDLLAIAAVGNSVIFDYLFKIALGRFGFPEFVVGILQKLPFPTIDGPTKERLTALARRAWALKRSLDASRETSHAFALPALSKSKTSTVGQTSTDSATSVQKVEAELAKIQAAVDEIAFGLYGIEELARAAIVRGLEALGGEQEELQRSDKGQTADDEENNALGVVNDAADLLSWAIGLAFGRFDVRLATGDLHMPEEPEPFDPLPICSPAMLADRQGLPCRLPPEAYPITWPGDGVLVDDAGFGGAAADRDVVQRVRQVTQVVWRDKASDIEQELCRLLGARDLREYLRKPAGFFEHHLKRYSKSRRKAPIYWPLSTKSGEYTIWVYYPRLTADTLYKAVAEHVGPKIAKLEERIAQLEGSGAKREGRTTKELAELSELLLELKEMREDLLRVAKLPYKPDLNDGVQITAAPLWRLFRLPRWRSELEKTWKALEKGEYDWAHIAYVIWPDRVKETCKTNRSLAIAHGLESLYEEPSPESTGEGMRQRRSRVGGGLGEGRS